MKSGKYYIGDPCYIFEKLWVDVLKTTNFFTDGEHNLFGKTVFGGATAYGDGSYKDNYGRNYDVDSGLLAIIPAALIAKDKKVTRKQVDKEDGMHIVEMKEDFTCDVNNGVFRFGDIVIDTLHLDDDGHDDLYM